MEGVAREANYLETEHVELYEHLRALMETHWKLLNNIILT